MFTRTKIRAEDVTPQALRTANIGEVIELIGIQEECVSVDITLDNINALLNLYQKAIEHYSALNRPEFNDYMNRQRTLLSREDVSIVLNSMVGEQAPAEQV